MHGSDLPRALLAAAKKPVPDTDSIPNSTVRISPGSFRLLKSRAAVRSKLRWREYPISPGLVSRRRVDTACPPFVRIEFSCSWCPVPTWCWLRRAAGIRRARISLHHCQRPHRFSGSAYAPDRRGRGIAIANAGCRTRRARYPAYSSPLVSPRRRPSRSRIGGRDT